MSDNRTRIWFSVFVLGVFAFGLATGLFLGRRMGPPPHLAPAAPPVVRGPMGGANQGLMIERLDRLLQFTDEQRAQIETILDERGGRLTDIQREVIARAAQERRALLAEIREVLTPQQQRRFDRWVENAGTGRGRGRGR
jgi:Spy/CpxP family protein refolding chaperone